MINFMILCSHLVPVTCFGATLFINHMFLLLGAIDLRNMS